MADEKKCTLKGRVAGSEGNWTYLYAQPSLRGSSLSPGQMAKPTFYYIRSFQNEFTCSCGGKTTTVITDDNFEVGTIDEPNLQIFAVAVVQLSIPAIGNAASKLALTVAKRIFRNINTASGWVNPAALSARANAVLGSPTIISTKQEEAPIAMCGKAIKMATGVMKDWPPEGEKLPPPTA